MAEERRTLLSIGAFFIVVVIVLLLHAAQVFTDWTLIFPLVFAFFGLWLVVLAAVQASNPKKYERGAFSTLSLGLILIAVGGAWFLSFNLLYSLALILLVLGALAIAAALKRK